MKRSSSTNVKEFGIRDMSLVKPAADTCPECAVKHSFDQPHNVQSLYYQYKFYQDTGRWPTWGDAMLHCDEKVKERWKQELAKHNIKVEEAQPIKTAKYMWIIYDKPADYPEDFIIREWRFAFDESNPLVPGKVMYRGKSIEEARTLLRNMGRKITQEYKIEDPCIVETYL